MKKLAFLAASLLVLHSASAQTQFNLDFSPQPPDSQPTAGYQSLFAGGNNTQTDPLPYDLGPGSGVTLDFSTVGTWSSQSATNPLTTDGLFANNGTPVTFDLVGLAPGSTVTLYAIRGWDRGALVSFGSGLNVDTNSMNLGGTNPTVADFTLVGTAVAPVGGMVSGLFTANANGDQGQVGGFIIQISSAIPEPSSVALLVCGSVALLFLLRRRIA